MCGLVGIAGDTSSHWKDTFTDLLIVDSLRGAHSTGVAAVQRFQSEVELVKAPGGPHNLIGMEEYKKSLNKSLKVLIGHNRYATIGEHTVENAHPFAFPTVVGAHNGTLDKSAIKQLYRNELLGTDSEAIYSNINEHGLKDTIEKLSGAWALTWYDKMDNTINFLRNEKRPLWYCYSKDRCTLMWASEVSMLEFITQRARLSVNEDEFYQLEVDQHFSWEIPDSITKKFEPPMKREMKAPKFQSYWETWNATGGYNNRRHYHSTTGGQQNNVLPFPAPNGNNGSARNTTGDVFSRKVDTSKFRPPYKDAKGKVLNKKEFHRLTSDGCVFCGDNNIQWGEFIKPLRAVEGQDIFLCEECYNNDEIFDICSNLI